MLGFHHSRLQPLQTDSALVRSGMHDPVPGRIADTASRSGGLAMPSCWRLMGRAAVSVHHFSLASREKASISCRMQERLATATCIARARAPFMLQPFRRHTHQPLSAVDSLSARASAGTCRRQTDVSHRTRPPRGTQTLPLARC